MAKNGDKDKEVPKHIADYKKHREKAKQIADTTELVHSEAYVTAAQEVLKDKDTNQIDYKKLDDSKVREQFVDKMTDFYLTRANAHFGTKVKSDDRFMVNQLLGAYAQITREELTHHVDKFKKRYTIGQHENVRDKLVQEQRGRLNMVAGAHLKDEHIDDLIKHVGAEKFVERTSMTLDDAKMLYGLHETHGAVTSELIKNAYLAEGHKEPIYLKKEEPKKKK